MGSNNRASRSRKRRSSKRRPRRYSYSSDRSVSSVSSRSSSASPSPPRRRHKKQKKHTHHKSKRSNDMTNKPGNDQIRVGLKSFTPPLPASSCTSNDHAANHAVNNAEAGQPSIAVGNILPGHAYTAHVNVVPEYDPNDGAQNIECWIHKVNECAQIYSWTDTQTCHYALPKLSGLAKRWYQGLPSLLYTWPQWVEKLKLAFPSTENYGDLLQRMLNVRCRVGQPLDVYYYEKMILINKCDITGRKAVGCLVHGIDDKFVRMSANSCRFEEPEQLFSYLRTLSQNDTYLMSHKRSKPWNKDTRPNQNATNTTNISIEPVKPEIVCYNCGELGHIRSRCTKPMKKCNICRRAGHMASECRNRMTIGSSNHSNSGGLLQLPAPSSDDKDVRRIETSDTEIPHVQSSELESEKYYKDVRLEGVVTRAFVDLGSSCTLIRESSAKKIFGTWKCPDKMPNLRGFGNSTVRPLGLVTGTLSVDDVESAVDFVVVPDHFLPSDVMIGQTFTELPDVVIIKTAKDLTFYRAPGEGCNQPDVKYALNTVTEVSIEAGFTSPIEVSTTTSFTGSLYIPAAFCNTPQKDYIVLPGLYSFNNSQGFVMISNVAEAELKFKKNQVLARGSSYEEIDEPSVRLTTVTDEIKQGLPIEDVVLGTKLNENQREVFHTLLSKYRDCFALDLSELGKTDLVEMVIQLKDENPVVYNPYRMSLKEKEQLSEIIEELLQNGIIRESSSSYASPVLLVSKKNGQKRLCVDYRALNRKTLKDKYPLPRIEDKLDCLGGNNFFTSLDLASGYYQVPVSESSKRLTAFVTPDGLYEFNRMPFGLANAPSVFQRAINSMINGVGQKLVLAYMDDLLVPSRSIEEGLEKLEKVFIMLRNAKLTLNLKKCVFFQDNIEYLGYEISREGIRPGSFKIDAVKKFPIPKNVHEVRQFVGLASYFRKFVRNFSLIARPLTVLTKKNEPWRFEAEQVAAFNKLKDILISRPVLALYEPHARLEVHTDASKMGLGAILLQDAGQGLQPIAFYSRQTSPEEQNFSAYELETLAVITALNRFRVYLLGSQFKIVTDCHAIRSTMTKRDLVPRVARWWMAMQEFVDFDIEYRPGTKMTHVDALSRNAIVAENPPCRDDDCHVFYIDTADSNIVTDDKWLQTIQQSDPELQRIVRILKDPETKTMIDIKNNFVCKNERLYRVVKKDDAVTLLWVVPKSVRWQILKSHHDDVGHFGYEKTYERIRKVYWFKKMRRFIKKYCAACLHCAYNKVPGGPKEGLLHPIQKPDRPFHTLHADHCGPFPMSKRRNSYILAIIDSFTKFIFIKPVKNCKTSTTINVFEEYFSLFAVPRRLITDRGTSFTSQSFEKYIKDKGSVHILNAVASPRANGQIERYNRSILDALTSMNHGKPDNEWDVCVPKVQWGLNNTINKATNKTPAHLLFSLNPTGSSDGVMNEIVSEAQEYVNPVVMRAEASERMRIEQGKQKKRFDSKRKYPRMYKVGDLVRVERELSNPTGQSRKLQPKCSGPYKITKVLGNDRYEVEDTPITKKNGKSRYRSVFAVDKIHPWLVFGNDPMESDSDAESLLT